MKSVKCPTCGFVGWADAEFCKRCGAEPNMSEGESEPGSSRPRYQAAFAADLNTRLATWSLVLGIISFLTMGLFGVLATAGVVVGIIAIVKTSQQPAQYGGRGRAIGGLVLSAVSAVAVPIAIIAAIAVPNLLAAKRAGNEASAQRVLLNLHGAESSYQERHGRYGNVAEMAAEELIDPALTQGTRAGYKFTVTTRLGDSSFECVAVPEPYPQSGLRSFYIDETGVMRGADLHGAEATRLDAPVQRSLNRPAAPSDAD